jgi:hypothetical protein
MFPRRFFMLQESRRKAQRQREADLRLANRIRPITHDPKSECGFSKTIAAINALRQRYVKVNER